MFQEQLEPDQDVFKSIVTSNSGLFVIAAIIWRTINKLGGKYINFEQEQRAPPNLRPTSDFNNRNPVVSNFYKL